MEVYIRVGLSRNGAIFLNERLFKKIPKDDVVFQPKEICKILSIVESEKKKGALNKKRIEKEKKKIEKELRNIKQKKIIISDEAMAIDPWSQDVNWSPELIKNLFPEANIIISLRYQCDWLVSLYKLSCQKNNFQYIEEFLNYHHGEFKPVERTSRPSERRKNIDVTKVDVVEKIINFFEVFEKKKMKVMFFEDFVLDKKSFIEDLISYIGIKYRVKNLDYVNRGPSALRCNMMAAIYNCFGLLSNINNKEICVFKKFYLCNALYIINKIQNHLDKLVYFDWDLLRRKGMRQKLDEKFKNQNRGLLKYIEEEKIPKKYLKNN